MGHDNLISIVYIEDEPEMINLVSLILKTKKIQVTGANTGQLGISIINDLKPDIVLLDIMMPDMDGWDVFQLLKNDPATSHIPIIMITAKSQPIDRVLGLRVAGVDDYIIKPFLPQQLFDSIENALNSRM
jgi:DNA-binding response OmpR family regulator